MQVKKRDEPYELEFVDRVQEWETYQDMVIKFHKCFFCIEAKDGFGKTWLLRHLCREGVKIPERQIFSLYIDLERSQAEDAVYLLRFIASKLDGPVSAELCKAINALDAMTGVNINTGGGDLSIGGNVIGGHQITINESLGREYIGVSSNDPYSYIKNVEKLTAALFSGLGLLQASQGMVLFLDNFGEKTTKRTREWLLDVLAPEMRSGNIPNLMIVLASKQPFQCFADHDWEYVVIDHQLGGIPDEFIREFWVKIMKLPEPRFSIILPSLRASENSPTEMRGLALREKKKYTG